MGITITRNLADQLGKLGDTLGPRFREKFDERRPTMFKRMAVRLESNIIFEVFGKQQSPAGVPWPPIAPLTRAIRGALGRANTKLGTGPKNSLIRSFRLGERGNVFQVTDNGFSYGTSLEYSSSTTCAENSRSGSGLVVEGFQTTSRSPRSDDDDARSCIQRWMGAVVGRNVPGKGKHLVKPGRRVLDLPVKWLEQLVQIGLEEADTALTDAVTDAMTQADMEVSVLAPGQPEAAGGVQFF